MTDRFIESIKKWESKAIEQATLVCKKVAIDLHGEIVQRTPHDTGRLKGNNLLSINNKDTSVLDVTDKEGSATQARALANFVGFTLGDDIWLTNNVEYAYPIEMGHSKQAPSGFFRVSVQSIVSQWRNIVSQVRSTST